MANTPQLASILISFLKNKIISQEEFCILIENRDTVLSHEEQQLLLQSGFIFSNDAPSHTVRELCKETAAHVARAVYGNKIFVRGLIEFTNYCKNNCYYCGIRAGNTQAHRYRLTKKEILKLRQRIRLGFRTCSSGGEDPFFPMPRWQTLCAASSNHPDWQSPVLAKKNSTHTNFERSGAYPYLSSETANNEHYHRSTRQNFFQNTQELSLYF